MTGCICIPENDCSTRLGYDHCQNNNSHLWCVILDATGILFVMFITVSTQLGANLNDKRGAKTELYNDNNKRVRGNIYIANSNHILPN